MSIVNWFIVKFPFGLIAEKRQLETRCILIYSRLFSLGLGSKTVQIYILEDGAIHVSERLIDLLNSENLFSKKVEDFTV